MLRTWAPLAAVIAVLLAAVGLTFERARVAPAEFRFANGTEPRSLDPHVVTGQPALRILRGVFEGLTRRDARTLLPAPGVAERWEISPDGKRYVFHLREDARWSDGQPVTAHDFAYSWRRLQEPATGAEYAYVFHGVRLAAALNGYAAQAEALLAEVVPALAALAEAAPPDTAQWKRFVAAQRLGERLEGCEAPELLALLRAGDAPERSALRRALPALREEAMRRRALAREADARFGVDAGAYALDARRFVVELEAPLPYFLELTAFGPAMPVRRDLVEGPHADAWFLPEHIVSNGPFELAHWRVNDRIRLERSEHYWGRGEVALASIDVLPIENDTTALNLFLTGEVDWLPQTYPRDLGPALRGREDFYATPGLGVYYYRFNTKRPPFDDARVRRAIGLAIETVKAPRDRFEIHRQARQPLWRSGRHKPRIDHAADLIRNVGRRLNPAQRHRPAHAP